MAMPHRPSSSTLVIAVLRPCNTVMRDVEQEDQRGDDDAELDPQRLLQIGARFGGIDVEQIAHHRRQRAEEEDGELDIGEFRRIDFAFRLFGDQVIGGAEKAEQQPDDQRIGVDHANVVEGQQFRPDQIRQDIDEAAEQSERAPGRRRRAWRQANRSWRCFGFCIAFDPPRKFDQLALRRRPALRVGPARPGEEVGEIVEFAVAQVELRHLAAARDAGGLRLHPVP